MSVRPTARGRAGTAGHIARSALSNIEGIVGVMLLVSILVIVLLQVVLRYLFGAPTRWSEELCRVLLAWVVFVGASGAAKLDVHPRMVTLRDRFGEPTRWAFDRFADACFLILAAIGAYYGVVLAQHVAGIKLVSVDASWVWWYSAFPFGAGCILLRLVQRNWLMRHGPQGGVMEAGRTSSASGTE